MTRVFLRAWLFLALTQVVRLYAQSAEPDRLASTLAIAQKALSERSWDVASRTFQEVLDLAREKHDEQAEARGLYGLASVAYQKARYRESRDLDLKALEIFERLEDWKSVGQVEKSLGNIAFFLADHAEAKRLYQRAVTAADRAGDLYGRAAATYNILRMDESPESLEGFASFMPQIRELHDRNFEADVLHSWGDHLFNFGDYEAAIVKVQQAASIFEETGNRNALSTAYNSLGRIFRAHGQPAAALQYQLKALDIQNSLNDTRNKIQSLNAVAVTYQTLADAPNARTYYERAIALAEQVGWTAMLARLRGNLGDLLVNTGDVTHGRDLLQQSLSDSTYRSARYSQISAADERLGEFDNARESARRAVEGCAKESVATCIYARLRLAAAELNVGDSQAALEDSAAGLHSLEDLHAKLAPSDFLKQGFTELWQPAYSTAIEIRYRNGDVKGALETAEAGRARALLDLMATREVGPRKSDALSAVTWRGAGQEAAALVSDTTTATPSADDLVETARRLRSMLLLYWVSQDKLYAWVVSPDGSAHGAAINVRLSTLERLVRSVASISHATGKKDAWRSLYADLIDPVERYLPRKVGARLAIVPNGPLLRLPFAALRDAQGRYLVERYTIFSVPSAAMLRFTGSRRVENARAGSMLLVADPASPPVIPGEARLPRLPGAIEETRAIARLVPASRTTLLTDTRATEPRVLDAASHKAVIHFATHATVRDTDPLSSFLALGVPPDGSADGRLTSRKIYDLNLDADLVVLSSCRSGAGIITGDGIAALARAFFYAGASSLIVSVWDVADEPAKRLMPAFYRAWLGGADKASALRSAQMQLIARLRSGGVTVHTPAGDVPLVEDPALWAGFVLIGEPD